jgi:hypothetical protein
LVISGCLILAGAVSAAFTMHRSADQSYEW